MRVVVIGAGQGGLSAAVHLRMAGHQVIVLERHAIGGKAAAIKQAGFTFDPGPSIIIYKQIYEDVFRRAGRNPATYLEWLRLESLTDVTFRGKTYRIPSDLPSALEVVRSFSHSDAAALHKLMLACDAVEPGIWKSAFKRSFENPLQLLSPALIKFGAVLKGNQPFRMLIDSMFESPLLRAFFYGFPSYSGQSYHTPAPGALLIPHAMFRTGVWYPQGGIHQIPLAFARLASELGAEIREGVAVSEIERQSNSVSAVRTDSGERIECDAVVANCDPTAFNQLLGQRESRAPSYSYFTLQWGLKGTHRSAAHHHLIVPDSFEAGFRELYDDEVFPAEPIVYLNNPTPLDPGCAPPGCTNLFAVVTSPSIVPRVNWQSETDEYRRRVHAVLQNAEFGVDPQTIVFERCQTPLYFESQHQNYRGSLYGLNEKHRKWGMFPPGVYHPTLKNVRFAGGAVQPGAGLPMVTLSGRFAAESL